MIINKKGAAGARSCPTKRDQPVLFCRSITSIRTGNTSQMTFRNLIMTHLHVGVALYRLSDFLDLLDGLQLVDEGGPYAYLHHVLLLQQLGEP